MKLLYLIYLNHLKSHGVLKKIHALVKNLNENGVSTRAMIFYRESYNIETGTGNYLQFERLQTSSDFHVLKELYQKIDQILQKEDAQTKILIRYPNSEKQLYMLTKKYPKRFLFEHNTIEEKELNIARKYFTFYDWLYNIRKGNLYEIVRRYNAVRNEMKYGPLVLANSAGGIAVTSEIADYERSRTNNKYIVEVISNGIDVSSIPLRVPPDFDGKKLNLMLLSGSINVWHGIDRLIKGLEMYSGDVDVRLHLVGNISSGFKSDVKKAGIEKVVSFHESKKGKALWDMMNIAHIGVGSLALHRIPLKRGVVLKVREYMANGLPFMIGYEDEDVENNRELAGYCHIIPADDSPVDIKKLIEFAKSVYSDSNHHEKLRAIAKNTVDIKIKTNQMIRFLKGES